MTSRKPVSAPDMSGLAKANPLLSRFGTDVPGPAATDPARAVPAPRQRKPGAPEMDRRSWYMPREIADVLAEEIDELHFTTRKPKWFVLSAIVAVAMDHKNEIRARLAGKDSARGDQ